ncbi:hypothetical protein Dimus_011303 [Dionaea muscipula]
MGGRAAPNVMPPGVSSIVTQQVVDQTLREQASQAAEPMLGECSGSRFSVLEKEEDEILNARIDGVAIAVGNQLDAIISPFPDLVT